MAPRLLVAISGHGYGHLGQVAPLLLALRRRLPTLELTLRTSLSASLLHQRIGGDFTLQRAADDFGVVNPSALEVDAAATARRYRALHREWASHLAPIMAALEAAAPDLLLADVPYLTLAAAARLGIPAIALCSLNWAHIYRGYCGEDAIYQQMLEAYNSAERFLMPEPSMPMPGLDKAQAIGPIAVRGDDQREALRARLGLGADESLVLVGLGGIHTPLPLAQWPPMAGIRFLVQADWAVQRADTVSLESLGLSFNAALASADALMTKPGYGSFVEAAVSGVPVLYTRRGDWPEEPALVAWMWQHTHCAEIDRESLYRGGFEASLRALLTAGRYPPVVPGGVEEAAAIVAARLAQTYPRGRVARSTSSI